MEDTSQIADIPQIPLDSIVYNEVGNIKDAHYIQDK